MWCGGFQWLTHRGFCRREGVRAFLCGVVSTDIVKHPRSTTCLLQKVIRCHQLELNGEAISQEFQRGIAGLVVTAADRIFDKDDAVAEINCHAHVGFAACNHQYSTGYT